MKNLEEIKRILAEHKWELKKKYRVKEIGLFGSFVRGEQKKISDIDILVEFEKDTKMGFLRLCNLENYLSELLGVKVDLVPKEDIREELKENILKEAVYL